VDTGTSAYYYNVGLSVIPTIFLLAYLIHKKFVLSKRGLSYHTTNYFANQASKQELLINLYLNSKARPLASNF
jgi:hypothetical protein